MGPVTLWMLEISIPARSNMPPLLPKSFCISTTITAVLAGSMPIASGFARNVITLFVSCAIELVPRRLLNDLSRGAGPLQILDELLEIAHNAVEMFALQSKFQQTLLQGQGRGQSRHHPIGKLRVSKYRRRILQLLIVPVRQLLKAAIKLDRALPPLFLDGNLIRIIVKKLRLPSQVGFLVVQHRDFKTSPAPNHNVHPAVRKLFQHVRDGRGAADAVDRLALDGQHSKLPVVSQAILNHFLVALFKNVQRKIRVGKQ